MCRDFLFCVTYIVPSNSCIYYSTGTFSSNFSLISHKLIVCNVVKRCALIAGDSNAITGNEHDFKLNDCDIFVPLPDDYHLDTDSRRLWSCVTRFLQRYGLQNSKWMVQIFTHVLLT